MILYSIEQRDRISLKGDWFLPFAKNMMENIDKNLNKNLSGKYS